MNERPNRDSAAVIDYVANEFMHTSVANYKIPTIDEESYIHDKYIVNLQIRLRRANCLKERIQVIAFDMPKSPRRTILKRRIARLHNYINESTVIHK